MGLGPRAQTQDMLLGGALPARGMPLNLPFPRRTAQAIWFRGKFKTT